MSAKNVRIVEVGARDGLQNESKTLPLATRLMFAEKLADCGIRNLELGAFVSSKWVPQMSGSGELFKMAFANQKQKGSLSKVGLSALVPNLRGMQEALECGVKEVAVFGSASESFSLRNINCTIEESLVRFSDVVALAKKHKVRVRGYLSMCFGCPFEGKISESKVVSLVKQLIKIGVYEVSIGDTIGVADPAQVRRLVKKLIRAVGAKKLAMHFHDTRGTALANIAIALELGIRTFDSSLGGLGGCPHAPSATGNVATEDVVYMVERMGYNTGLDLERLIAVNHWMTEQIGHDLPSRLGKAGIPRAKGPITSTSAYK